MTLHILDLVRVCNLGMMVLLGWQILENARMLFLPAWPKVPRVYVVIVAWRSVLFFVLLVIQFILLRK
jgi:hypothetical protein